jgi:hypothetical protein
MQEGAKGCKGGHGRVGGCGWHYRLERPICVCALLTANRFGRNFLKLPTARTDWLDDLTLIIEEAAS